MYHQVKLFPLNTLLKIIQFFFPLLNVSKAFLYFFSILHTCLSEGRHGWGQMNNGISGKEKETYNMELTLGNLGVSTRKSSQSDFFGRMCSLCFSVSIWYMWLDLEDSDINWNHLRLYLSLCWWENRGKPQTSFNSNKIIYIALLLLFFFLWWKII